MNPIAKIIEIILVIIAIPCIAGAAIYYALEWFGFASFFWDSIKSIFS